MDGFACYRGALADSAAFFEQALAIERSQNISDYVTATITGLAVAYAQSGRGTEALELAGQIPSSFSTVWRAKVYFLAGRRDQALEAAGAGLSGSRQRGEQALEAWALLLLGHIAVQRHTPDAEAAEGHYRDALSLAALSACAHSSPTATSASGSSTATRATVYAPRNT